MRNRIIFSVAALMASTGLVAAQQGPQGGSSGGRANTPSATESAPGKANETGTSAQDKAPGQIKDPKASARDDAPGRAKETGSSARDEAPGQNKAARDAAGGTKENAKTGNAADDDRNQTNKTKADRADRDGKVDAKPADGKAADGKATDGKATDGKAADGKGDNADRTRDRADGAQDRNRDVNVSITNVTPEQKVKVKSGFTQYRREPARNINVSVNVGVKIPRTVEFYAIPQDIVVLVPAYSSYRYFWYEERVVIVDPNTYEVVDIIVI